MKLLLDTNIIIDFLKDECNVDLSSLLLKYECFTSVIVKLELLKFPEITPEEENAINEFLKFVPIIQINPSIETEAIFISRSTKLKLPDAIIGATAIIYDAKVVTNDEHFLECSYNKLEIWDNSKA